MSKRMNQKRSLFLIGGVIALLAVATVVLALLRPPGEEVSASSQELPTVDLTNHKLGELASLTVENSEGGYTIRPTEPGVESYRVEELRDLSFNHDAVKYTVQQAFDPVVSKEVGPVEDLAEFGLKDPSATITMRFDDGTAVVCLLGDAAPSDEDSRYLCLQGSDYVYLVGSDTRFLSPAATFADLTVVKAPENSDSSGTVQWGAVELWGSSFPDRITLTPQEGGVFQMSEPVSSPCDDSMVSYMTTALKSVTATRAVAVFPDEAALEKYGLDEPDAAVRYSLDGETFTLLAAKKDDSTTYLMREGLEVIFEIPTEDVDMWTATSRYLLKSKSVVALTAADTASVTITAGDRSSSLTLTRERDEDKSTESTDYYQYTVTGPQGQAVRYDPYSRLLEDLSALRLSADTDEAPSKPSELTLTYRGFEEGAQHTLEFVPLNGTQLFAVVDGEAIGLVDSTNFQNVQKEAIRLMDSMIPEG